MAHVKRSFDTGFNGEVQCFDPGRGDVVSDKVSSWNQLGASNCGLWVSSGVED